MTDYAWEAVNFIFGLDDIYAAKTPEQTYERIHSIHKAAGFGSRIADVFSGDGFYALLVMAVCTIVALGILFHLVRSVYGFVSTVLDVFRVIALNFLLPFSLLLLLVQVLLFYWWVYFERAGPPPMAVVAIHNYLEQNSAG